MNVADSNATGKPSSEDLSRIERMLQSIEAMTEQLMNTVQSAGVNRKSFDAVERGVPKIVFRLGHQAIELFVLLLRVDNLGAEFLTQDNQTLHRSDETAKTIPGDPLKCSSPRWTGKRVCGRP